MNTFRQIKLNTPGSKALRLKAPGYLDLAPPALYRQTPDISLPTNTESLPSNAGSVPGSRQRAGWGVEVRGNAGEGYTLRAEAVSVCGEFVSI